MANNPASFRFPWVAQVAKLPPEVQQVHTAQWNAITDLYQATEALSTKVGTGTTATATATTTNVTTNTETVIQQVVAQTGTVNNQTGATAYTTAQADYGTLIVLANVSGIAVTLSVTVNGITLPWYCRFANYGAGTATLTPVTGTITYAGNVGAVSMPLLGGAAINVYFDGTSFWAS